MRGKGVHVMRPHFYVAGGSDDAQSSGNKHEIKLQ